MDRLDGHTWKLGNLFRSCERIIFPQASVEEMVGTRSRSTSIDEDLGGSRTHHMFFLLIEGMRASDFLDWSSAICPGVRVAGIWSGVKHAGGGPLR